SMEEFHRDLQKCYGHLRFRRTLRTPTTMSSNGQQTAATIPLINKKKQQQQQQPSVLSSVAGAIPAALRLDGSSPGALESGNVAVRLRGPTPPLPGLPLNAGSPILLTKKKAPRPGTHIPFERTNMGVGGTTNPNGPAAPLGPLDDTPLGPNAITREIPKEGLGSTVYSTPPDGTLPLAAAADSERGRRDTPPGGGGGGKKRKTLPLGTDQSRSAAASDARITPVSQAAYERPTPETGDLDAAHTSGVDIGPVMISLPGHSGSAPAAAERLLHDRATPRVSAVSGKKSEG
ncbi:MAG: hypothetical protein ABJA82_10225, partial [Myxococcales bacterium]